MSVRRYQDWLRVARRHSRRDDEAEDLLQDALLAAWKVGRRPLERAVDAPWFHGVLSRSAAMRARTAARERLREWTWAANEPTPDATPDVGGERWSEWPPGLRQVLLLTLSGLTRPEICQVLGISDAALRQRLAALRRRSETTSVDDARALAAAYAHRLARSNPPDAGLRRAALARGPAQAGTFRFGISDGDGNLFAFSTAPTSQNAPPRQPLIESAGNGPVDRHDGQAPGG